MKIISYAQTTPAVIARRKRRTRRAWSPKYAAGFHAGEQCQAYDKSPRNGGKRFGIIVLTAAPFLQSTSLLTPDDWEAEGFEYLTEHNLTVFGMKPIDLWEEWITKPRDLWVVNFDIVSLEAAA